MFVNVVLCSGEQVLHECESVARKGDQFELEPTGVVVKMTPDVEAVYYMNSDGHTIQRHRNKKGAGT